ncbi:hypothetical protein BLNAU_5095 [Blattamonas nauphoetae]|uniref:Uncharacterized protein n=1 Tax=Blattamonas nauphoetae TaxID=2049346 RepID=A0ABQ9Y804_9EUKA|nr:hypothetical protein BLNAU_5089 [Blattamonas nauphoetae]KAK2959898.1 hypothetical protein BLNAU_5095 [Blattamonas nauphoetae]
MAGSSFGRIDCVWDFVDCDCCGFVSSSEREERRQTSAETGRADNVGGREDGSGRGMDGGSDCGHEQCDCWGVDEDIAGSGVRDDRMDSARGARDGRVGDGSGACGDG